ncbi:putative mechanosensitive ion channel MscS, LSM domain superfamily [Helianthus annuus]|nr:putative mechanosensitive ion channel MscS, LSM domain superfamily [Helianthus annuus]
MRPSPSSPPPHSGDRSNDVVKLTNGNVAAVTSSTTTTTKQAELITPYTQNPNPNPNPNSIWRDSSYDFTNDGEKFDFGTSDTTSPQQSPALSRIPESPNNYGVLTPKEVRVSFHEEVVEPPPLRQRSIASGRTSGSGGGGGGSGEEVVVCSANGSFKRKSSLMRTKTKSRLMDPPEPEQRSGKTPRAGGSELDEDDPFLDDDLPDEYKQLRYSKWTILQLLSLILIIAALICTLTIPFLEHKILYDLVLWKWGVMILVLICGLNQKNISAWNMKRLMNIVRTGVLSTLDEQLDDGETAGEITNEKQAKVAAKKIFHNVAKQGSKRIYLEDLMRFLREDEALKAIRLFDAESETKGISKGTLKNWVVNAFRERRALALSLNDTKTAVNKLHQMLNVVVGVLIIMIWLLILKVATTKNFIFLSSQLLLVVFVFGNTCKTTFEAIVFLFVMHPYDVGDRCEIDGVQMIVEEMNILTTVFLRYDNQKIIYPNSVLATKPIANYYRSPDMGDAVDFCIHVSTPVEKVALMKERITSYIENKSDHWYPAPLIVVRDVEDMNRLKISIWLSHRMNFQDMGERWQRRALLVEEMIKIFRELDIEYRMLPVDINVRNMPTLTSNRLPSNWLACTN